MLLPPTDPSCDPADDGSGTHLGRIARRVATPLLACRQTDDPGLHQVEVPSELDAMEREHDTTLVLGCDLRDHAMENVLSSASLSPSGPEAPSLLRRAAGGCDEGVRSLGRVDDRGPEPVGVLS